nr:hypothetical protein [Propionicimonas sp.]
MMRLARILVPIVALGCVAGTTAAPTATAAVTTKTVRLTHSSSLSTKWKLTSTIGYGTAAAKLGTSPGGEGLMLGLSYGVQLPDTTWWYADAAKKRLAHYSDAGAYLGQAVLPTSYLHLGSYFQWANPQALADGTVVLTSTTIDSPALMLLSPKGAFSRVLLDRFVNVVISDGHSFYGFDEAGRMVKVKPRTGVITSVTRFKGQGGRAFSISVGKGFIKVVRPGVNLKVKLVDAGHPTKTVHPAVEATVGADGKLWILATGIVELSPTSAHDVAGLFSVSTSGSLSATYKMRTLYSDSDPADGHHLGIRLGSSRPTLMFVDTDATRVYRKK